MGRTVTVYPTAIRHPLDPLTANEVRRAVEVLRHEKGVDGRSWRFAFIGLKEPSKPAGGFFDRNPALDVPP